MATLNKIFLIGFNRTATGSLTDFFQSQGIPAVHWAGGKLASDMLENVLSGRRILSGWDESHTFFSDMEGMIHRYAWMRFLPIKWQFKLAGKFAFMHVLHFETLDIDYPGSKFILNIRNEEAWIKSRFSLAGGAYAAFMMRWLGVASHDELKAKWRRDRSLHHDRVLRHFKDRPSDLLVWDLDTDPIQKVCDFFQDFIQLEPIPLKIRNSTPQNR